MAKRPLNKTKSKEKLAMSVKHISSAILGVGVDDTTIDLFIGQKQEREETFLVS